MTVLTWGCLIYLACLIVGVGWILLAPVDPRDGDGMR